MIKIHKYVFLIFLFSSCSLNDVGGFWTKKENLNNEKLEFELLFEKEEIISKEFNKNFNFNLNKENFKFNKLSKIDNNDGYVLFDASLNKIQKYNFSKIKNFHTIEPNLVFHDKNIIFFDNNGTILNFNENSKLNWKTNNYSKNEKKLSPLISMANYKNRLFVSDNLSKIYSININDGKVVWSKKNDLPFNSEIKLYDDKIFVVDTNNNLNCFSTKDGNLIWQHKTEKSFINSSKKLSILAKDKIVIFSNSLGDITAVDVKSGALIWQKSTQNSRIYEDVMTLKISNIIENNNSIFFSNNKNEFYSLDFKTGIINWTQDVNSNIKPAIIGDFIFTVSLEGYFFIIEKNTGNILRIKNIFDKFKLNKNEKIFPTGFVFNDQNLFISTTNGKLILVDIKSGNTKNILKIDNDLISRPFVQNQNMYLIKDNSIIKLN